MASCSDFMASTTTNKQTNRPDRQGTQGRGGRRRVRRRWRTSRKEARQVSENLLSHSPDHLAPAPADPSQPCLSFFIEDELITTKKYLDLKDVTLHPNGLFFMPLFQQSPTNQLFALWHFLHSTLAYAGLPFDCVLRLDSLSLSYVGDIELCQNGVLHVKLFLGEEGCGRGVRGSFPKPGLFQFY